MQDFKTIAGTAVGEYEEKKSRFIASASHAGTEEEALAFLASVKEANRTARHNVYAYRLQTDNRERYSDDGEPAKTAGTPTLETIRHAGLSDIIIVTTRYFGGTLLGTGGLVRAYTAAAEAALEAAHIVTVRSVVECSFETDYGSYEKTMRVIEASGAGTVTADFAECVRLKWVMPDGMQQSLSEKLTELSRGQSSMKVGKPFYAPF